MKQTDLGLNLTTKRMRTREFLAQMERVVPWTALVELITSYASESKKGRLPFAMEAMLRIHLMQQWSTLSDPVMEEALHHVPLFREFVGLGWDRRLPDENTILRFRHVLERSPPARRADPSDGQRPAQRPRPAAQGGYGGRRHHDRCAEFDKGQGWPA